MAELDATRGRVVSATDRLARAALRPATLADRPGIERLLAEAGLPTAGVAEILAARPGDFLVATDARVPEALVGVAGLELPADGESGNALLRSVAVHPTWRQHGLGRALVHRLVREAEARGLDAVFLLTTTAEHYFSRFGFVRVERDAVPAAVRDTVEFRSACPATAVAMARYSGP